MEPTYKVRVVIVGLVSADFQNDLLRRIIHKFDDVAELCPVPACDGYGGEYVGHWLVAPNVHRTQATAIAVMRVFLCNVNGAVETESDNLGLLSVTSTYIRDLVQEIDRVQLVFSYQVNELHGYLPKRGHAFARAPAFAGGGAPTLNPLCRVIMEPHLRPGGLRMSY